MKILISILVLFSVPSFAAPPPFNPIVANPFSTNRPPNPVTNAVPIFQNNYIVIEDPTPGPLTNHWGGTTVQQRIDGQIWTTNRINGALSITTFGAVGDGVTDCTTAIQEAIDMAVTSSNAVFVPGGVFLINSGLSITNPIQFFGLGYTRSVIKAGAAMDSMLRVALTAAENSRSTFRDFQLDGGSLATNGIYSDFVNHCVITRIRTTATTGWGVNIGFGWCNSIVDSEMSYSSGGGIRINSDKDFGGNNALLIQNCKVFLNDGIGIQIQSGYNMNLIGNTIESNAVTGVFMPFQAKAVNIFGGYIEQNGAVGHTFTNLGSTIKSQIIINGVVSTNDVGYAFPCENVRIEGVFMSDDAQHTDSLVWAAGVTNLVIQGNTLDPGGDAYVFSAPFDKDFANPGGVTIADNVGFNGDVLPTFVNPNTSIDASTWRIKNARWQQYCTDNSYEWSTNYSAAGTIAQNAPTYLGFKTISVTGMDNDTVVGTVLDLDEHTELRGKLIQIGAWVKANSDAPRILAAFISNRGQSVDYTNSVHESWLWIENQAVAEASGTMVLGFKLQGGDGDDVLYFSNPILCEVGVRPDQFYPRVEELLVRKNNNYLQLGTWSGQDNTTNGLALVTADVDRWRIDTSGHMSANGNNNLTSSAGDLNFGTLRARQGAAYIYESSNPNPTATYFLTTAAATKGYVGFPGASSVIYLKNQLNGGTRIEDTAGVTFTGNLFQPNDQYLYHRDAADSADLRTIGRGSDNEVTISTLTNATRVQYALSVGTVATPRADPAGGKVVLDVNQRVAVTQATANLTGDDSVVTASNNHLLLNSDNATPANRTFVLNNSGVSGQWMTLLVIAGAAQIVDDASISGGSGTIKLSANWEPSAWGTLMLYCDGTNWVEVSRSTN